jgi:hypothetical protein
MKHLLFLDFATGDNYIISGRSFFNLCNETISIFLFILQLLSDGVTTNKYSGEIS